MIAYVISDVHVDFQVPQSKVYLEMEPYFEKFYEKYFHPADVLYLAGDIANDYYTQSAFLRFIAKKYSKVYTVFGNHDLLVRGNTTFGNGNPFDRSEERMQKVVDDLADFTGVHILQGDVVDGVGGSMGFADFMYGDAPSQAMYYWERRFIDSRGWNFKRNRADVISRHFLQQVSDAIAGKPRVMITHYCPLEMGIAPKYADDPGTPCFYFNARAFMESGYPEIWVCGHTHDQYDTTYEDTNGVKHRILCNPLGYPSDYNNFMEHFGKKTYLIEV